MKLKTSLKQLYKLVPHSWFYQMQYIHFSLLSWWIFHWQSQPLIVSQKSVMVFSPHQDDETFGCGGMIAQKREYGIPVTVVFLTDGRGTGSTDTQKIGEIRKQESLQALSILGVEAPEIHFLEKPDGTLQKLAPAVREATITKIAELLKHYQPGEIYVPHYQDCHQDHEASFILVKAAIAQSGIKSELLQYPIWLFWRAPIFLVLKIQDIASAYRLDITAIKEKKRQAIAAYASQIPNLPPGFVQGFLGSAEIFFKSEF